MQISAIGRYGSANPYQFQRVTYAARHSATTAPVEAAAKTPTVEQGQSARVYLSPAQTAQTAQGQPPELRQGADPVEMAVRSRIQYLSDEEVASLIRDRAGGGEAAPAMEPPGSSGLPGAEGAEKVTVDLPGGKAEETGAVEEAKSAQEVAEEAECKTCAERRYQDGSNDPGVSFKTPGHIDPGVSASVVRGHELEHVVRNQAEAQREDRRVVSQTVTLHTAICPECGKTYTSGGTTRTVTAAQNDPRQTATQAFGFEAVA